MLAILIAFSLVPAKVFAESGKTDLKYPFGRTFELASDFTFRLSDDDRAAISSGSYRPYKPQLSAYAESQDGYPVFDDLDESLEYLRACLSKREDVLTASGYANETEEEKSDNVVKVIAAYSVGNLTQELLDSIFNYVFSGVFDHTGIGDQGDYLLYHTYSYGISDFNYDYSKGIMYLTYVFTFYTDAEQERAVAEESAAVLGSLGLEGKNEYERFLEIYEYITHNIVYDYDNLEDQEYLLKYTAYAAIIDKKAVCQGYANLLYRMLLESGIDCRIISGKGNGGGHAWNIVRLGDLYYNVDSTWDAAGLNVYDWYGNFLYKEYPMTYRLRCNANFPDHERDEKFETDEFNAAYPMSDKDFDPADLPPEPEYVAIVRRAEEETGCYFETFDEALEAAGEDDVITLLKNVESNSFTIGTMTLDLDGHELFLKAGAGIFVYDGSPLIRSGSISGAESSQYMIDNSGSLTLEGLDIDVSNTGNGGICSSGELNISDCSITGSHSLELKGGCLNAYDTEMLGTVHVCGGNAFFERIGIYEALEIESGSVHIESGYVESIVIDEDAEGFSVTRARSGAEVGSIPPGYEWQDAGGIEVLKMISTGSGIEVNAFTGDAVEYSVEGSTVTVSSEVPCRLGYLSDGSYQAVEAQKNDDGTHSYTIPDGVDEVILVVMGDSDGDGSFTNYDVTLAKAAAMGRVQTLGPVAEFAMDVSSDGEFSNYDITMMKAMIMGRVQSSW